MPLKGRRHGSSGSGHNSSNGCASGCTSSSANAEKIARLLFAMLKQKSLKDIDWTKVAHDPVLLEEISNGHAARMRYARYRASVEKQTQIHKKQVSSAGKNESPPDSEEEDDMDSTVGGVQHHLAKINTIPASSGPFRRKRARTVYADAAGDKQDKAQDSSDSNEKHGQYHQLSRSLDDSRTGLPSHPGNTSAHLGSSARPAAMHKDKLTNTSADSAVDASTRTQDALAAGAKQVPPTGTHGKAPSQAQAQAQAPTLYQEDDILDTTSLPATRYSLPGILVDMPVGSSLLADRHDDAQRVVLHDRLGLQPAALTADAFQTLDISSDADTRRARSNPSTRTGIIDGIDGTPMVRHRSAESRTATMALTARPNHTFSHAVSRSDSGPINGILPSRCNMEPCRNYWPLQRLPPSHTSQPSYASQTQLKPACVPASLPSLQPGHGPFTAALAPTQPTSYFGTTYLSPPMDALDDIITLATPSASLDVDFNNSTVFPTDVAGIHLFSSGLDSPGPFAPLAPDEQPRSLPDLFHTVPLQQHNYQ